MGPILVVILIIVLLMGLVRYQEALAWPMVRMPLAREGFANKDYRRLEDWLPDPGALTKKSECDDGKPAPYNGLKQGNFDLVADAIQPKPLERVAVGPTSEQCYKIDYTRALERAGSYAQRTNNYKHGTPESCTAPNHDLILNFYETKGFPTPYQV